MSVTVNDTLTVHVNRHGLHSLDVPQTFEADGSFTIALQNHGEAVHVHLHLDDALSEVATIDAVNHHLTAGAGRSVQVEVADPGRRVRGKLKVVSAYGAETRYVDVAIEEEQGHAGPVEVDESLAKPRPRESRGGAVRSGSARSSSLVALADPPLVVVGVAALVLSGIIIGTLDGVAVLVGILVVFVAAFAAGYLIWRTSED